ncbi:MAG TPA: DUF6036 family nucleotidyltransferase [Terracidiphilus sp.]|nr:DUF6036 family nucleotidyltransferase [Terracidiphilus sp.]
MFQDFKDLLSAFNARGVKYLIVGGYAVIFHAQPRATQDIDLLIHIDPANADAVFLALSDFGSPLGGVTPEDFKDKSSFFRFGRDPHTIDLLPEIPGVDFEHAWKRRVEAQVDSASGLKAWFISAEDLIASKISSGRLQDLADVEAIRKTQQATKRLPNRDSIE